MCVNRDCSAVHSSVSSYTVVDTTSDKDGTVTTLLIGAIPHGKSWVTEVKKVVGYGKSSMIKVSKSGATVRVLNNAISCDTEHCVTDWAHSVLITLMKKDPSVTEIVAVVI